VYGRQAMVLGDNVNALLGWKFLRVINSQFILSDASDDTVNQTKALWPVQRVRWTLGPLADYIWIGIWYLAEDGGTTPPKIAARLYELAGGTALSHSIEWTDGAAPGLGTVGNAQFGAIQGDDQFTHTGWSISDPAGSQPGLLNATGKLGQDVELRLTLTKAKLYSVSIMEVYRSEIT